MENRVIIFGIYKKSILETIAAQLGSHFSIIGYSDEKYNFVRKEFNYMPYYGLGELKNVYFDYIVIATDNYEENKNKKKLLLEAGVANEKIIEWILWARFRGGCRYDNSIEYFKHLDRRFNTLVFGLSHAYHGLLAHQFKQSLYKFTESSFDLFFMYKSLIEVLNIRYIDNTTRNIIFEIPYYAFNYDYSRNQDNFRTRLNWGTYFKDMHNYIECENAKNYIHQFNLFSNMFEEKIKKNKSFIYNNEIADNRKLSDHSEMKKIEKVSHVWRKLHEPTIKFNINILDEIIYQIMKYNNKINLIFLVMPQSKYIAYKEDIEKMRNLFYYIMEDRLKVKNVYLWDYCDFWFNDDSKFKDKVHLNTRAAIVFSRMISDRMEEIDDIVSM